MRTHAIEVGENFGALWDEFKGLGYQRARVDGVVCSLDDPPSIDRRRKHVVEIVVDRATIRPDARLRIADSMEKAHRSGRGRGGCRVRRR
ncbi:MAG: hypothetical protein QM811_25415 [Pirellulales bacterium]